MPSLLFCDYSSDTESICRHLAAPSDCIVDRFGARPRAMWAYVPYRLTCDDAIEAQSVCALLEPHGRFFTQMCLEFGAPLTLGLAEMILDLRERAGEGLNQAGASVALAGSRLGRLTQAMHAHQGNILAYHQATRRNGSTGLPRGVALGNLQRSGRDLNQRFALELQSISRDFTPRYRTLVSGSKRVPDMVRRTRKVARLDVNSHFQAGRLARFRRFAKRVGRGILVVDLGLRALKVHDAYEDGGDWLRQMFMEMGGFAGAAAAGIVLSEAGAGAIGAVAVTTRSGWAVVLTAAAATQGAAMGLQVGDQVGQTLAASAYDKIVSAQEPSP